MISTKSMMPVSAFRVFFLYAIFVLFCVLEFSVTPTTISLPTSFSLTFAGIFILSALFACPLPFVAVFFLGLITDLLSGAPLGLYAAVDCSTLWVSQRQITFLATQSFPVVWISYGVLLFAIQILIWFAYALYYTHGFSLHHLIQDTLYGFFIFPFLYSLYHVFAHAFPAEREHL